MISEKSSNQISMSVDDIIGYINIKSINLTSNLMQGLDNTFYLSHDYLRGYSENGEFFLDFEGDLENNNNPIIYSRKENININYLRINDLIEIGYLKNTYCYKINSIKDNIKNNKYDLLIKVYGDNNKNILCKRINC